MNPLVGGGLVAFWSSARRVSDLSDRCRSVLRNMHRWSRRPRGRSSVTHAPGRLSGERRLHIRTRLVPQSRLPVRCRLLKR